MEEVTKQHENKLDQLRNMSTVVADTGDIDAIGKFKPIDATTNPSLLFKAAQMPQYRDLVLKARSWRSTQLPNFITPIQASASKLLVDIAADIQKLIPGKVSLEVDARASFDSEKTIALARALIELCGAEGVDANRVLVKIAATWEGIRAAEVLQKEGINCNLTLVFSQTQAIACADAGAFLISPFVGRIYDWYLKNQGFENYTADTDPGVVSVKSIYQYLKTHNYQTVVMGASFRTTAQIEALAGCDRLTISPALLTELQSDSSALARVLDPEKVERCNKIAPYDGGQFRWELNQNSMATEKLAEGIRLFAKDSEKLEQLLTEFH